MPKYIDWYIVELESHIREKLKLDRVHSIIQEVNQHLLEAYEENLEKGMADEDAQLAAMERFGNPAKVAMAELGQRLSDERKGYANAAICVVAAGAICLPLVIGLSSHPGHWFVAQKFLLGVCAVFAILAYLSRKLLFVPLALAVLASAAVSGIVAANRFVPETALLPKHSGEAIAHLDQMIAGIKDDIRLVEGSSAFFSTRDRTQVAPYAIPNGKGYIAPTGVYYSYFNRPVGFTIGLPRLDLVRLPDWAEAKRKWHEVVAGGYNLPELKQSLTSAMSDKERITANAYMPASTFYFRQGFESLSYGLAVTGGLWIINLVCFGLGKVGSRRVRGSWLHRRLV